MQIMAVAWQRCALLAWAFVAIADGLMTMPSIRQGLPADVHMLDMPPQAHVLAMPEQKLAFCFVQKVASQHFAPLFNDVNNITVTVGGGDYDFSTVKGLGLDWTEMTRENGWRFAMFVRHPLERYLSAFLDKCVHEEPDEHYVASDFGVHCFGPTLSGTATWNVSLEAQVALFEERVRHDLAEGLADNPHWLAQYAVMRRYCGEDRFAPEDLDFLGHMTYDNEDVNRQVREMLQLTSLPGIAALAEKHFPTAKAAKAPALVQCGTDHCSSEHEDFMQFYHTPDIVRGVVQLFQEDFDHYTFPSDFKLNFTVPGLP
mmetsp:Transcript_91322/g.204441  ORF Transcript_91322/g.204441 Transcript_91322/m.204441 type:complete len:315 (-) Transcript_91322:20-964(-)